MSSAPAVRAWRAVSRPMPELPPGTSPPTRARITPLYDSEPAYRALIDLIGRSMRACIDLEKIGPRTIWVDCDVLQADGGTRTAAITGASLALAVRKLQADGKLTTNPLLHPVAAVSIGIVKKQCLLDLCYVEDAAAEVDLNLVMNGAGAFIEVQGSGEESTFDEAQLAQMLAFGKTGIRELLVRQQAAIETSS